MKVKLLKSFRWDFKGHVRSLSVDQVIDVTDEDASQMIEHGYAAEHIVHAENKMLKIDYQQAPLADNNVLKVEEPALKVEQQQEKAVDKPTLKDKPKKTITKTKKN